MVAPGANRSTSCRTSSWNRLRCSTGLGPVLSSVTELTEARPRVPSWMYRLGSGGSCFSSGSFSGGSPWTPPIHRRSRRSWFSVIRNCNPSGTSTARVTSPLGPTPTELANTLRLPERTVRR